MRTCSVDGCERPHDARGLCGTHYKRWSQYGDPLAGGPIISPGASRAFLQRAILHKGNDCLLWPYAKTNEGYGHVTIRNRSFLAHRVVLSAWRRQPDKRAVAAHLCGNGHLGCVNPQHLSWTSQKDNLAHRELHGRYRRIRNGAARFLMAHGHLFPIEELAAAFGVSIDTLAAWGAEHGVTFHEPDSEAGKAA